MNGNHVPKGNVTTLLENNIINDISLVPRATAIQLLTNLDTLFKTQGLTDNAARTLGSRTDTATFLYTLNECARYARKFFKIASEADAALLTGVLQTRGITVGPVGRDRNNRSTRCLYTVKGRIVFD